MRLAPESSGQGVVRLATTLPNKGMKQTSVEHIGRSQLIPGVRQTWTGITGYGDTRRLGW